ncbi:MAG TPA: efflux RND transporter permease subunit [Opitutales bacterium]|nr:efflux RND transporter permease subunit [Opitutales bacterium]
MDDSQKEPGGMLAWMAKKSIAANLLMLLLIAGGFWTAVNIQKEVFPEFELDIVSVRVAYPGAAPAEVEQGILQPVEEAIRGVQGIREVSSTAREGSGSVTIELIAGANRMKVFQDIDQAVNRIRTFPDDIEEPEVVLQSRQRDVMEIGLYGPVDVWTLRQLAEELRIRLLAEEGLTQVEINGVPDFMTHVEIPRHRLREYGLTLGEVARIIEDSSNDVPAGSIETNAGEILLRMKERKQWAEEFSEIKILTGEGGATLTLGEIAEVRDGFEEYGFHSQFNEQPSVEIEIFRVGKQSPLDIEETVKRVMDEFAETAPDGVQLRIDSNRAQDFRERLTLLLENGLMAIVIVLAILSLFLEFRLAFWVMMGMTTSFVGGIVFLPMLGVSINMVSMFAFLISLGIVVDDAIVVGENIYEYRQKGMSLIDAAIQGVRDIAGPVTFSILTNVVAFVPLLFMPGTTGKFWWPIPAVVITVLLVSLFEALFILPAHLGHVSKRGSSGIGNYLHNLQQKFSKGFSRFVDTYYRHALKLCLEHRYITFSAAVALFVIVGGYARSGHMGMILMPEVAADEIEAGVRLPVGITRDQSARVAEDITRSTLEMFDEHNLYEQAEGVKTNVRNGNFIDVEIVLKPPAQRTMRAKDIITLWRENIGEITGVDQITFEAERGPGGWRQDIVVDLSHSNIDTLERATAAFVERMKGYATTTNVNDNYNRGKKQFDLKLLPEGRLLGLTSEEIGRQVRDAFYGSLALRQLRGIHEIEVRVKLPEIERESLDNLENFIVRTPDGVEVPLLEVVEIKTTEAFSSINRRNGRRVVSVGMDVQPKRAIGQIIEAIELEEMPQLQADFPGLTFSFEGSQSDMRESTQALKGGFILAMLVIYSLLAVAFGSYVQPLIVMVAIPFGIIGGVIGHILLGYDLSLISLMGMIALSGVVVNDSLIMIDFANRNRGEQSAFAAITQAGVRRFRPIILTTLTTFGGLTPIILETSQQAAYLIPMAISLGFGIVFATSIILILVPSLYLILEDLKTTSKSAVGN